MSRQRKGTRDLPPAPGELRLIQAFVNTVDRRSESDELASPRALADWLADQGLRAAGTETDADGHERTLAVREAWRSMIAGAASDEVAETLDRALAAALLCGRHRADGTVRLEAAAEGLDGALARLLAVASAAQADGGWQRLKICASADCRVVFYDRSSNRSGRWCRPRCGNRHSSRLSKRRSRHLRRQAVKARRAARTTIQYQPPSLDELEADPQLGDMARALREREKRQ